MDARMFAMMGRGLDLIPDNPEGENQHELKELQMARMGLVKDRTRLMNRVETHTLAFTRRQTKARLAQVERQLTALEAELKARLRKCPSRARDIMISCVRYRASVRSQPLQFW
jgi:transposase